MQPFPAFVLVFAALSLTPVRARGAPILQRADERVGGEGSSLAEAVRPPAIPSASGEGTSEPFALYLGSGFRLFDASSLGSAVSPAFTLRTFGGPFGTPGVGAFESSPFALYLGAGFSPNAAGGTAAAASSFFSLYSGRFREGFAQSNGGGVDLRPPDPGIVLAPTNFHATPEGCSGGIVLTWSDQSPDEDGFFLERKPGGFSDAFYTVFPPLSPNAQIYVDRPPFGGSWTYRLRAFRGQARSPYAIPASASPSAPALALNPSASVVVKNVGNRRDLRVHVQPPVGAKTWAGVSSVSVWMGTSASFSSPATVISRLSLPASGEIAFDFAGNEGTDYWFRVYFGNSCGADYEATTATVGPRKPQRAPVLFVHGFLTKNNDDWNAWAADFEQTGFPYPKAMTFQCNWDSWEFWAKEIAEALDGKDGLFTKGDWADQEQCNIVAHSQGGLASRSYVEQLGGWKRVRALFMLGTPNHGSDPAKWLAPLGGLLPPVSDCNVTGHSNGGDALRPRSEALAVLNYGDKKWAKKEQTCDQDQSYDDLPNELTESRRHDTRYYVIAGTSSDNDDCEVHRRFRCTVKRAVTRDPCTGDGWVGWQSARLRALLETSSEPCAQWLDTDLNFEPYNVGRLEHMGGGADHPRSYKGSAGVRRFVREALSDHIEYPPSRCMRDWVAPAPLLAARRLDEPTNEPELVSTHDDTTSAAQTRSHVVTLDRCSRAIAYVGWRDGSGTLSLRAPDSMVFVVADTATIAWLHFEADDELGYAAFAVDNPTPGRWTIQVEGGPTGSTIYTETWVVEGAPFELDVTTLTNELGDRVSQLITASLLNGGAPAPAIIEADVVAPSGSATHFVLQDDGADGDLLAGDHVFSARYFPPSVDGEYVVKARAREWPVTDVSAERIAEIAFSVLHRPKLVVDSTDLSSAPPATGVGQLAEIRATIHNFGSAGADSVNVQVTRPFSGDTLATLRIAIPAGDSAAIAVLWTPDEPGAHRVRVELDLLGQLLDDGSQTLAEFDVTALAATEVLDAPVAIAEAPKEFALGPPIPNPTRGSCAFQLALPIAARAKVTIYDVQGRRVAALADGYFTPGRYTRSWDGRDASGAVANAGVYFASLEVEGRRFTRRIVRLR